MILYLCMYDYYCIICILITYWSIKALKELSPPTPTPRPEREGGIHRDCLPLQAATCLPYGFPFRRPPFFVAWLEEFL